MSSPGCTGSVKFSNVKLAAMVAAHPTKQLPSANASGCDGSMMSTDVERKGMA
jgi:hypothetical protein